MTECERLQQEIVELNANVRELVDVIQAIEDARLRGLEDMVRTRKSFRHALRCCPVSRRHRTNGGAE